MGTTSCYQVRRKTLQIVGATPRLFTFKPSAPVYKYAWCCYFSSSCWLVVAVAERGLDALWMAVECHGDPVEELHKSVND